ncbi:hypothetical protein ACTFIU_001899 [Dictyostelium citrinum]
MNIDYQNITIIIERIQCEISIKYDQRKTINFQNKESSIFYNEIMQQLYNWKRSSSLNYIPINESELIKTWFIKRYREIININSMLLNNNKEELINIIVKLNEDRELIINNLILISNLFQNLTYQIMFDIDIIKFNVKNQWVSIIKSIRLEI